VPKSKYRKENSAVDALYVTPDKPHQLSLNVGVEPAIDVELRKGIDVVYVTRFQKERWAEASGDYPRIDAKFLKQAKYAGTSVLHPLPRVGELDVSLDSDSRAVYFRQAAYGVPVRMALIDLLIGREAGLTRYAGGFATGSYPLYDQRRDAGIRCPNPNCITNEPLEQAYVRNRFWALRSSGQHGQRLRCIYCEADAEAAVAGHVRRLDFEPATEDYAAAVKPLPPHLVFFRGEAEALAAGYHPRSPRRRAAVR
jgi:hypothetical protein